MQRPLLATALEQLESHKASQVRQVSYLGIKIYLNIRNYRNNPKRLP